MKFFKKKHLINYSNSIGFIQKKIQGKFCIYFSEYGLINFFQFKALVFFLKKRLKFCTKLFLRVSTSLFCTKKPIGVRMGKGKGSLDSLYLPVKKGQIFVEFFFKKKNLLLENNSEFLKKIRKITVLLSKKLHIKINLLKT